MTDRDHRLELDIDAPPAEVYRALTTREGLAGWWTPLCEMEPGAGGRGLFRFPRHGFHVETKTVALEENQLVEWECTDQAHPERSGYRNLHDWVGTTMRFEIAARGEGGSRLSFVHAGLLPLECVDVCIDGWQHFLAVSLKGLVESGAGEPYVEEDDG